MLINRLWLLYLFIIAALVGAIYIAEFRLDTVCPIDDRQSFCENVEVGIWFFVIETILVAILAPSLVGYIDEFRWSRPRRALAGHIFDAVLRELEERDYFRDQSISLDFNRLNLENVGWRETFKITHCAPSLCSITETVDLYSACISPKMAAPIFTIVSSVRALELLSYPVAEVRYPIYCQSLQELVTLVTISNEELLALQRRRAARRRNALSASQDEPAEREPRATGEAQMTALPSESDHDAEVRKLAYHDDLLRQIKQHMDIITIESERLMRLTGRRASLKAKLVALKNHINDFEKS